MAWDDYANYITINNNQKIVRERMKIMFLHDKVSHLHKSCFTVAKIGDQIVGEISCCRGNLIPAFNRNVASIVSGYDEENSKIFALQKGLMIEREASDDEYYIDTISVHPDFRRQGIAETLIKHAMQNAKKEGFHKVVLLVDIEKSKLQSYYEKLGFVVYKRNDINDKCYNKMIIYV